MGGRFGELLIILLIILILFGAGRLPQIMNDIGKSIRELKNGLKEEKHKDKKTKDIIKK